MCAVQENVQIGCTGNVHIAAVWMMGNNGCVTVWMELVAGMETASAAEVVPAVEMVRGTEMVKEFLKG